MKFPMQNAAAVMLAVVAAAGGQGYQPRYPGDPARSQAEAGALGYLKTVVNAQREYRKKKGVYAPSLAALVNHGSFTRRLTRTDRGEYTVSFRGTRRGFWVALTPKQFDAAHRAFFADEGGEVRVEVDKQAAARSPVLK